MMKKQNITVEARWSKIAQVMKKRHLDMVLVCASTQDFGFAYSLSGLKPILYHYLTFSKTTGKMQRGYFIPYYIIARLGLTNKRHVETFDDKIIPAEFKRFLTGKKRVGIIGPAPAVHFSETDSELVFLDELLWPLLNVKTDKEIAGIGKTAKILKNVLTKTAKMIKPGMGIEALAKRLDRELLKDADALAFPSLVECVHEGRSFLSLEGVQTKISLQDAIYINVGAEHAGYFADSARMFFLKNDLLEKRYLLLEKSFLIFMKGIKPGLLLCHLPALLKAEMLRVGQSDLKLDESYIGHSIGFNILNLPYIGRSIFTTEKVQTDTTLSLLVRATFEGIDLKIQDTVWIGGKGNKILTR